MPRISRWFPLAWAVVAYGVLVAVPVHSGRYDSHTSGGAEVHAVTRATLAAINGQRVYLLLMIPVVAAALPALPWPPTLRRPAAIAGATIVTAFIVYGMATVGLFFLPCAFALVLLAQRTRSSSRPAT